jgi:hypothetical protein
MSDFGLTSIYTDCAGRCSHLPMVVAVAESGQLSETAPVVDSGLMEGGVVEEVLETTFKGQNVQISGKASSTLPGPYHRLALVVQFRSKWVKVRVR